MRKYFYIAASILSLVPSVATAHEVYVLDPETVASAMNGGSLPVVSIASAHAGSFFFWMFITIWTIFTVLSISIAKPVEKRLLPLLQKLKPYAPLAGRITLGLAIISSAQFDSMFGPELPFTAFLAAGAIPLFKTGLIILGTLILFGLFTRVAGVLLCILYIGMWPHYGTYMLTYANYFGEMLLAIIVGNSSHAIDRYFHHLYPHVFHSLLTWIQRHAFLILRVTFGISLIYASLYAKFLHAQLAIETVVHYNLTAYFPFSPEFIVLGAFAIEMLLGIFILFGIEIRFATLFLLFWLTLSLLYFREAVWPHIVLAGVGITLFMHGYDRYTLEWGMLKRMRKGHREPVL